MEEPEYWPDYTEEELQTLIKDRRFLAAVHAYSLDLMTLQQFIYAAVEELPICRGAPGGATYYRLVHEAAERIHDGHLNVPADVQSDYAFLYDPAFLEDDKFLGKGSAATRERGGVMFSDLQDPEIWKKYLKARRRTYNEEDIQFYIKDTFFLALADAFAKDIIDGYVLIERIWGDYYAHIPRDLNISTLCALSREIARRMWDGVIDPKCDLKAKHPDAYVEEVSRIRAEIMSPYTRGGN